ncbi:MAG: hypothetical protein JJU12_04275 [Chlamydiales bacterium]|nr:hypothetical protein [Chlamydiales bacterium]
MAVPGISPTIISHAFIEPLHEERRGLTSDDILIIGLLHFFNQLHQVVLNSWEKFRESQSDINEQRKADSRSREQRSQEIEIQQNEASRRQIEARNLETEGDVPLHAGRPHRAKRRFHESLFVEGGYSDPNTRQLNLPV